jgi:hypothetical protein
MRDDTLLIIDPTDISKKYAKHMQYLSKVGDGSTGQIRDGYWVCSVVGAHVDSDEIIPLYHHLYSAEASEFISENFEAMSDRGDNPVLETKLRCRKHPSIGL